MWVLFLRRSFLLLASSEAVVLLFERSSYYCRSQTFLIICLCGTTTIKYHIDIIILARNRQSTKSYENLTLFSFIVSGLKNLDSLGLAHNKLREVPSRVFSHLTLLNSLELDGNNIDTISPEAFAGLEGKYVSWKLRKYVQWPNIFSKKAKESRS